MEKAARLEPARPLHIGMGMVDQVARMKRETRIGRKLVGHANRTRPMAEHIILRIAKIEEPERFGLLRRRVELNPFRPAAAPIADPVGIEPVRFKPFKNDGVVVDHPLCVIGGQV